MTRKLVLRLFLVAGCALLCEPARVLAKTATHTIKIENMVFSPAQQTVAAGDLIIWENKDLVPHTATAENGSFDSKTIAPGKSWRHRVRKKGTLDYKCLFHPTMKASLTVK